ncbi:MAG TPA: roadblock/LC7 domain-containing protein [Micromonosporaceae bacterium]|nr:roadblock/LC7 domain-containing protein [Micromonosporaceae bacterium]
MDRQEAPGVHQEIAIEIKQLRARRPDIAGVLVATVDGLLVAHDTGGLPAETIAAMAAAQLGLGHQLSVTAGRGAFQECVTRSGDGCLAVFAAGTVGLLAVLGGPDFNVGLLYRQARPTAMRLGALLALR